MSACWIPVRVDVTTDDTGNPSSLVGHSLLGIKAVEVSIKIEGTDSPSWSVTPIFWNSHEDAEQYMDGDTLKISNDDSHILFVEGSENLYFRVDGSTGTNPKINIWVRNFA